MQGEGGKEVYYTGNEMKPYIAAYDIQKLFDNIKISNVTPHGSMRRTVRKNANASGKSGKRHHKGM